MEAIVAVYADWGIGYKGTQPIVVPEDRRHFREITGNYAIIAGRRTFLDFPGKKPLPGRNNYILTNSPEVTAELTALIAEGFGNLKIVGSVEEAVAAAAGEERVFVCGGGSVYAAMLPYIDRVHVTKIDLRPDSDTFFNNLDENPNFCVTYMSPPHESGDIPYRFMTYERI